MSLLKLQAKIKEVESDILRKYEEEEGDITSEETALENLRNDILGKIRYYAHMLKGGFFKKMTDEIDEAINELRKQKEYVKKKKEAVEGQIHHIIDDGITTDDKERNNGIIVYGEDEDTKPELYVTKAFSITRRIDDIEKVDAIYKKYDIPTLSNADMNILIQALEHTNATSQDTELAVRSEELMEFLMKNVKPKVLVTDLPTEHPSIIRRIRPTVKITKNKPKPVLAD